MTDHPVVSAARSWIGTRFHHQGRLKKTSSHHGGVDCLGLLVGVALELDLRLQNGLPLASFDERDYSHYPDSSKLLLRMHQLLSEIEVSDIRPADIVLLKVDDSPQHLAIISNMMGGKGIIHAFAPARAVVEHALDDYWLQKIVSSFRLPTSI